MTKLQWHSLSHLRPRNGPPFHVMDGIAEDPHLLITRLTPAAENTRTAEIYRQTLWPTDSLHTLVIYGCSRG